MSQLKEAVGPVLIGCEESQVVCMAFRDAHPEWHYQQDIKEVIASRKWGLIIHPDCTSMAVSGDNLFSRLTTDIETINITANKQRKIIMNDGRGQFMAKKGAETRQKIKEHIAAHPDDLKQDVCKALGISRITLRKHLNALGEK